MKKNLLIRSFVALFTLSLALSGQAQVREIKMYATADATIFKDQPTVNGGGESNNMLCNTDSLSDGTTRGYEEAWIKWDLSTLEAELGAGEEILYAEARFFVSWNSTDTGYAQGYHALHMDDIFDGWNEGNGAGSTADNLNGITWNSAKGVGDFELPENYETITVVDKAKGLAKEEIVPMFDAMTRELGAEGNKVLTLRMAPVFTDPNGVKKWLGFHTKESPWNGDDPIAGVAVNAPYLTIYVGQSKSQFSDNGALGIIENFSVKPSQFGYWLVGEDEGDDRLLLNKASSTSADNAPGAVAIFNDKTYTDLEMSVKAKMNEVTATGGFLPFNDFIMIFGYEDENNFSYFQFIGINESGAYKVVDGVRNGIGSPYPIPPVSDTGYHDYKITRTGSEVVAYVDDVEYHRVSDDALNAEGKIGIGSHNNTVFFDDFSDGQGTDGIEEAASFNSLSIYPNPVKESFIISSEEVISSYKLVDILGNTILRSVDTSSSRTRVDLEDIPAGMYFVVAEMQSGASYTSKIIVER